jgi:hypothetical protein
MAFCRGAFAEVPEAPRRFVVRCRCWNNQLDLRAAIYFTPDRQLAAHSIFLLRNCLLRTRCDLDEIRDVSKIVWRLY